MSRHYLPVARLFGISIGLDYSWFLIFVLLTWSLAVGYYPREFPSWSPAVFWVMGAITAIMLFVSVLLHELGHSVVAMRYNIPVRRITLFVFGGVAQIDAEPPNAAAEFWIAIAGPVVSFGLAGLFDIFRIAIATPNPLWALTKYLTYINALLGLFNLIPGFPLDGGRVLRAVMWEATKNFRRATVTAATVGRIIAFLFIVWGVSQMFAGRLGGGLWIAFIGWFLESAAAAQVQQVMVEGLLAGHRVSEAMNRQYVTIEAATPLQELVDRHILGGGRRSFIVAQGGEVRGLVTLHQIKEVPRERWSMTTAGDAMTPISRVKRVASDTGMWAAIREMDRDGVNQLPVMGDGQVLGMLSREDVIAFLRTLQELGV